MDMIETKALEFAYPAEEGEKPVLALRGVDTAIEKGSFVVVLGHNGSGKSTFAKSLNAILLPCGGKVYVEGMDTQDEACLLEIRRRVGMVFQNPDNQIVANVVEEDVAFGPENLGVPTAEIRRRVDDALAAVGMEQFARHAPHLLSGGQKQRIAIAGILAMEPECIVLDEATAMLDPAGRREVIDTVRRLNRERGITVVLITHHMAEAESADRVIVMNDGQVAMDGAPHDVFAQVDRLHELGLAAPDTVELLHLLREAGMDVPLTGLTVDECADHRTHRLRQVHADTASQRAFAAHLRPHPAGGEGYMGGAEENTGRAVQGGAGVPVSGVPAVRGDGVQGHRLRPEEHGTGQRGDRPACAGRGGLCGAGRGAAGQVAL